MILPPSCTAALARHVRVLFRGSRSWLLATGFTAAILAQTLTAGKITGRIFNPATQQYVRNAEVRLAGTDTIAYSGDDGSYVLTGVPAGSRALTVTFTGYEVAAATVALGAGQTATQNFDLTGSTYRPAAAVAQPAGELVTLGSFVVSSEREGNAKAIMDQRAALNMMNAVATDNFGDVTSGSIGEFVKYIPGVVLDYTKSEARAARIGGLDPKYVGISLDGMRMANASSASFGAGSRGFEFDQTSINSIESIEVSKTLTAKMDADATAGSINLKSKNAFERRGREVVAEATLTGNAYALTLRKTPGPDDGNHLKVFPGAKFSYSESFDGRLGVQLNVSTNTAYTEQENGTTNYDFSNLARGPFITNVSFRVAPKITRRDSFGASFDYRIAEGLVFSLRTTGAHFNDEYADRTVTFLASAAQIDPSSTLTRVIALATNNANTRMDETQSHRNRLNDTVTYTPKLVYKLGDLALTAGGGYSRSRTHYGDINNGFFQTVGARLTRMSWMAERDSPSQPGWRLTQRSGLPWSEAASLGRNDNNANSVRSRELSGQNQVFQGYLEGKKTLNLGGLLVLFETGAKTRLTTHDVERQGDRSWTYVGAAGTQTAPTTVFPVFQNFVPFDPKIGGNIASLNLAYVDNTALHHRFLANPTHFLPDTIGNFRKEFIAPRGIKEQIDSGYVEGSTRLGRLRLDVGLRHERTRYIGRVFEPRPDAVVTAAGYTVNTIPYIVYQYRNGERSTHYGDYGNWFMSGGAKYSFTPNLVLQVAGNQSILRPGYDKLAGITSIDETQRIITLPNPQMKPEYANKIFVSLQYYLEPAGTVSVSTYQIDIKNKGSANTFVTAEAAGYGNDPDYAGYSFRQPTNLTERTKMKGVDFEYSQQLVFLPGFWRGFSVFGSISRTIAEVPLADVVPKAANGGVRFSNRKFNLQLRATWQSAKIDAFATNEIRWWSEQFLADLSAGYKLTRTYELTLSGRNITNSFQDYYSNEPGLLRSREILGPVWTLGVRGRF
jgi:TonB-dependent receptor